MNRAVQFVVLASLFFSTVSRLPAPIREQTATPIPEVRKPKVESPRKHVTDLFESGAARRFLGTWRAADTTKDQFGNTFSATRTLVIKVGNSAEFASEVTMTLGPGKTWSPVLPAPYDTISPIKLKVSQKATAMNMEGSNLRIQWPGTKIIDCAPKTIPVGAFDQFVGRPDSALYSLNGEELIITTGNKKRIFTRVQ